MQDVLRCGSPLAFLSSCPHNTACNVHCFKCSLVDAVNTVQCTLHNKQFKVNAMFLLQCNRQQVNQHPATRTSTRFKWDIWDVLGCTVHPRNITGKFRHQSCFQIKRQRAQSQPGRSLWSSSCHLVDCYLIPAPGERKKKGKFFLYR